MKPGKENNPAELDQEAKKLYQSRKYQQAADFFSEAAEIYSAKGEESLAAEMKNNQSVALLKANQPQLALKALQGTAAVFQEKGDLLKLAMTLANQASAYQDLKKDSLAQDLFQQAADIFMDLEQTELYLETMQSISGLKLRNRNIAGSLVAMQQGLQSIQNPTPKQKLLLRLLKIPQQLLDR